jgi:hypothetical protein
MVASTNDAWIANQATAAGDERAWGLSPVAMIGLLLAVCALALALRLALLSEPSLWTDELFTVLHAINLGRGEVDARTLAYVFPYLAFESWGVDMGALDPQALWTWRAAGLTEWTMRLPFAIFAALSILLLSLLCLRTLGALPTLVLAILLAFSPWHLWMSQVARFYVQLFFFYNAALLLYMQATENGEAWRAAGVLVCLTIALFTTPIAVILLGVIAVDVVYCWLRDHPAGPAHWRPAFWAVALGGVALSMLALILLFLTPETGDNIVLSRLSTPAIALGMVWMVGPPMVVVSILGLWSLLMAGQERLAVMLTAAAVVPLMAMIAFNVLGLGAHVRYAFFGLFAWLALAAFGIERTARALVPSIGRLAAWLPGLALLATFAVSDYVYYTSGDGYRAQWRQAAAYVEARRQPHEAVAGDFSAQWTGMYYLEEPDYIRIPRGQFDAETLGAMLTGPTWVVAAALRPSTGDRGSALDVAGDLRAYFANRVAQPAHVINVYYYEPDG